MIETNFDVVQAIIAENNYMTVATTDGQ